MSLNAHIEQTKAHLDGLKRTSDAFGGPCWKCRYGQKSDYSWQRICRSPLVRRGEFNSVTGEVTWLDGDQTKMRKDGGLCGLEGRLFEGAAKWVVAWRWLPKWIFMPLAVAVYFCALIAL